MTYERIKYNLRQTKSNKHCLSTIKKNIYRAPYFVDRGLCNILLFLSVYLKDKKKKKRINHMMHFKLKMSTNYYI